MSELHEYVLDEISLRLIMLEKTTTYRPLEKKFEFLSELAVTASEKAFMSETEMIWLDNEKKKRYNLLKQVINAFSEYASDDTEFQKIMSPVPEETELGEWLYVFHEKKITNLKAFKCYISHMKDGVVIFDKTMPLRKKIFYWLVKRWKKSKC